jgi:hypothetical protein
MASAKKERIEAYYVRASSWHITKLKQSILLRCLWSQCLQLSYFSGDLLYKISGVSGKMTTETAGEDDNFGTEQSQKAIQRRLGETRCHRVLVSVL